MHINLFSQKKKERYDKTQEENVNQNDASTKNKEYGNLNVITNFKIRSIFRIISKTSIKSFYNFIHIFDFIAQKMCILYC
jgi:hypothetical protein